MKIKLLIGLIIILLLATGGFFAWQQWFFNGIPKTVILREDLPPAPGDYKTLNEDPVVTADIPENDMRQYREGFEELLQTIEEHPDSFGAWFNLGSVKHFFGDYKGAEAAWLYATEISPLQARSLMNLGDLYKNKLKDYERAEWAYLTAIERSDLSVSATQLYRDLASLYRFLYTEKRDRALGLLNVGIENIEDNSELLVLAGMWAWEDELFEEAEKYYEQFLLGNPGHEEARKDLDRIRRREQLPR
jgi:tetratricopeptide (TPR) repeat protein